MQIDPQPQPLSRRARLAIVALWIGFTISAILLTWVATRVKTGAWDLVNQVIWESGWIGWAPMSLLALALCRRFPLDRRRLSASAARLAGLGIGVVFLQLSFEFSVNTTLGMWLRDYPFDWSRFLLISAYKSHAYYAVYWMIVGAAHAVEYHRRYRASELISSQLEARLANAELDRLKTQLQPHFLFNAHHTIVSLMLKQENDAAIRMLTRLSDLLRKSLSRSGQQFVTLREELDTLRLYLEIQRERFRDRLAIAIDAPPELLDAQVPHLLLQPLVENAFRHGLEDVSENGRLEIAASRDGDALVCVVRDNGAGFDAGANGGSGAGGIGLANTRERLQQLYGARQSLAIRSPAGGGCEVAIRVPYSKSVPAEPAALAL